MPPRQLHLFDPPKPLTSSIGLDVFRKVPATPGVYIFADPDGRPLYIGQSSNLKSRLNTYKNASPDRVSRKIVRLTRIASSVTWEVQSTPLEAQLRENSLLRLHRPKFNSLNTYTGNYWFFSIRQSPNALEFSLAHTAAAGDQVFGAFKGGARNAYCSMCRLIFMDFVNLKTLLEWPAGWFCEKFPNKVRFPRSALRKEGPALDQLVADYWAGVSDCILDTFYQRYKSRTLPGFAVQLHASDLNCLETFYTSSLLRHAKIRSQGKGSSALVSKDELDDLLLIHRHTETNSLNKGANRSSVPGKRSLS